MASKAKRMWSGLNLWLSIRRSEEGDYVIDQTIRIRSGREEGRHVSVDLTAKEARELAEKLSEYADRADRYNNS